MCMPWDPNYKQCRPIGIPWHAHTLYERSSLQLLHYSPLQPRVGLGLLQEFPPSLPVYADCRQFLHPSFATSSFTPPSQRSLSLPLWRFPSGSFRRTLLTRSSSSWRMTCPAHLSLLSLQNFTMSFSPYSWLVLIHHLPPSITGP
jgi:hypothetical protein